MHHHSSHVVIAYDRTGYKWNSRKTELTELTELLSSSGIRHICYPGISDHDAFLFGFNTEGIIRNNSNHYTYLYQKADLDGIINHMSNFLDTFISIDPHNNSVEHNWLLFKKSIHEALENMSLSILLKHQDIFHG